MTQAEQVKSFVIVGRTADGQRFRPSDWAERLCGVMSSFGPGKSRSAHITYSPYVMPDEFEGVRCVAVDARLHRIEPMAYRFLLNFARDNRLVVTYSGGQAANPSVQAAVSGAHV